jgi:hypothetical protein
VWFAGVINILLRVVTFYKTNHVVGWEKAQCADPVCDECLLLLFAFLLLSICELGLHRCFEQPIKLKQVAQVGGPVDVKQWRGRVPPGVVNQHAPMSNAQRILVMANDAAVARHTSTIFK